MIKKPRRDTPGHRRWPSFAERKTSANLPSIQSQPRVARDVLTPRERAVLRQIGRGASSKEAGETLGVSARTIEFHRVNIMRKLGVRKIVDLMLLAIDEPEEH